MTPGEQHTALAEAFDPPISVFYLNTRWALEKKGQAQWLLRKKSPSFQLLKGQGSNKWRTSPQPFSQSVSQLENITSQAKGSATTVSFCYFLHFYIFCEE